MHSFYAAPFFLPSLVWACIRCSPAHVRLVDMQTILRSAPCFSWVTAAFVVGLMNTLAAATNEPTTLIPSSDRLATLRQSPSWKIALLPHGGDDKLDEQIRKSQSAARTWPDPRPHLERLGWLFVAKARASQ